MENEVIENVDDELVGDVVDSSEVDDRKKITNKKDIPTQQYLLECLEYNPDTGLTKWKTRPIHHFKNIGNSKTWNSRWSNKDIVNIDSKGYLRVKIDYEEYRLHRIIWKMYYGYDSEYIIDHINGDRTDNRIENLREATSQENVRNKSRLSSKNTSGYTGVHYDKSKKKWLATIKRLGKTTHLGSFDTIEEAVEVREAAAKEMFGEFYRDLRA